MSQLEISKNVIESVTVTCLNGVSNAITSLVEPIINASIQFLSIVRITPLGALVGVPSARLVQPTGAGALAIFAVEVFSSSATDNSVYQVFYVNPYKQSQQFIAGSASTLGAGVQYAP
jgi:hypothetical protein